VPQRYVGGAAPFLALFLWSSWVSAQTTVDSRTGQIETARAQKAQTIQPPEPAKKGFGDRVGSVVNVLGLRSGATGFRVKVGGVVSTGGFAPAGLEYRRPDLAGGEVLFKGRAQVSFRRFQKYDLQFGLPGLWGDRAFLMAYSVRHDYPGMNYYGPGPDTRKTFRSNYRLENTGFNGTAGVRPFSLLSIGVSLGYLFVNVGPGTNVRLVSTERVFTPVEAPGINRQANFLSQVGFIQFDYRDNPKGPRSGGNYTVEYGRYLDKTLGLHDFRRVDIYLQQYIPFFNQQRVIVLNGKSVLTFPRAGQTVPFYLQPTLGGAEDLRGFRPYRFYDNNMIAVSAEYQWRAYRFLDLALFADAGKVFPRRAQWNFKDVESSVGFGLRFNIRDNAFLRADIGFSHEGFQVWLRFNNVFGDRAAGPVIHSDFVDGRGTDANRY